MRPIYAHFGLPEVLKERLFSGASIPSTAIIPPEHAMEQPEGAGGAAVGQGNTAQSRWSKADAAVSSVGAESTGARVGLTNGSSAIPRSSPSGPALDHAAIAKRTEQEAIMLALARVRRAGKQGKKEKRGRKEKKHKHKDKSKEKDRGRRTDKNSRG